MIFFFSSRRRHTRWPRDWSQTCALPICFATGYVDLPLVFAGFGVMISRSFVRTMPISFRRADWLVYTVRAFEFSAVMHTAAVVWHLLAVIASRTGDAAPGGQVVHPLGAAVCADRKSTRLNSSHVAISYAVFCLKKKNIR